MAPLIKITGNQHTCDHMSEDMDFNAAPVLTRAQTLDQAAKNLLELVVKVAAGQPTKPEKLGHREYFIMYKHQNTPGLSAGCHA